MIEINLLPDVKQEFIRAQRVRTTVVSIAILLTIIAAGIVVLLAVYVFGAQQLRHSLADGQIRDESQKLQEVEDIDNVLTIQHQLSKLSEMHTSKNIDSRLFDALSVIIPAEPNTVIINSASINSEDGIITIEAQANNGYPALEVFRKTIQATNFEYSDGDERIVVPFASDLNDSDRSYGEDQTGKRVLRFTISFAYPEELFARDSANAAIVGPERRNATDSAAGVPSSLFGERIESEGSGE